jgi:hypothetical protein
MERMNRSEPSAGEPGSSRVALVLAWLLVSIPLLWGIAETIKKAAALFR